jgi:hypothetical protein
VANGSKSGTWSITSSKSLQMDLVLGIHAGNATGSFLRQPGAQRRPDQVGQLCDQLEQQWRAGAGVFQRHPVHLQRPLRSVAPVPEPSTYAMLLAGLAMVGWLAWRRRSQFAASVPAAAA